MKDFNKQILQELEKNGFCHIPSLLSKTDMERATAFFEEHKQEFVPARVGARDQKKRVESIRGDYTYWLDPLSPQEPFNEIFDFLNTLKDEVNGRFFLGLKQYECHLAYYPSGTFYHKHLDRFENDSSRRVSFIFYLNQEWDRSYGGELVLYDRDGNIVDTIYPMPGSFITFLSDEFPHEVRPSVKERRSLTGWMHNKIIY